MYKHLFTALAACLLVPIAALSVHINPSASSKAVEAAPVQAQKMDSQELGAVKARLSQLLELNRAFDDCIDDDRILIEEVSTVLLDQAVELPSGELVIHQQSVLRFIEDLYGRKADPAAGKYDFLTVPDGYFAIPARGYDTYSHEIQNLHVLENGDMTVLSSMSVNPHDSDTFQMLVVTLFRPNANSPFGYNILRADIIQ
ncbi:MAG: hypothetical protein HFE86_05120 [Clostridiales bacterium]|nr:hypothetical protein [Clostridiales bacterium]